MSVFEERGVPVRLITSDIAELDVGLYLISDESVERIGRNLKAAPFLSSDRSAGPMEIRTVGGYDVLYVVTTTPDHVLITVSGIVPSRENKLTPKALKAVELLAMFRGAIGL